MTLARDYNRRLQAFDRLLRVRWSDAEEAWLLERKSAFGRRDLNPAQMSVDTYVQRRDGYFTLGSYEPRRLPSVDRLIAYLKTQDSWQRGTADELADDLDVAYVTDHRLRKQKAHERHGDYASDAYDDFAWRSGMRGAVSGKATGLSVAGR